MLRRTAVYAAFEARLRREPVDYERNVRVFELLREEARELGALGRTPRLDGIERDIRYAAALKRVAPARGDRP